MKQELEELKAYCISKGVDERFFYSYYTRLFSIPLKQCEASKKYDFQPGGRNHWTPLYKMITCFIEKMPEHPKIKEWKETIIFLENNKPKSLNQHK
jgi:hypothetical protein